MQQYEYIKRTNATNRDGKEPLMDLLEYGMKYESSSNPVKRTAAKGVLAAARLQADLYEHYLEKKIPLSPEFGDDKEMLERILANVKEECVEEE